MKVFLSHSSGDSDLAHSISDFLTSHGISVWMSSEKLKGGDDYIEQISEAISTSDKLMVLVSNNSVKKPNWVAREVTAFVTINNSLDNVIPILFDETNPDQLFDGLGRLQHISFLRDQWRGYQEIAVSLGFKFSYGKQENSDGKIVTIKDKRKALSDRRRLDQLNMARRLRIDLWNHFQERHDLPKFTPLKVGERGLIGNVVFHVLQSRYTVSDPVDKTGELISLDSITSSIEEIIARVFESNREMSREADTVMAIHWIEEIANTIADRYLVGMVDRRNIENLTTQ